MLRCPLLIVVVLLLDVGGSVGQIVDGLLIVILILMDSLDGAIARRLGQETLIGSALDIAVDRAVEIVLWVAYAHLQLIPVIVPLTVVIRGALTDSIRNVALQHDYSPYAMMRSRWGRWLVASPPMRSSYAAVKAVAFVLLAVTLGLRTGGYAAWHSLKTASSVFTWTALAICIARGLPVLVEAPGLFRSAEFQTRSAQSPGNREDGRD
jgi:CDP-diacylglycerol--glycerol-3-phosphate 3-phosphatidyltransferase